MFLRPLEETGKQLRAGEQTVETTQFWKMLHCQVQVIVVGQKQKKVILSVTNNHVQVTDKGRWSDYSWPGKSL